MIFQLDQRASRSIIHTALLMRSCGLKNTYCIDTSLLSVSDASSVKVGGKKKKKGFNRSWAKPLMPSFVWACLKDTGILSDAL